MPILKRETDIYPPELFEGEIATSGAWWAMYTLARHEKKLMRQLLALQVPFYAPVIERRYRSPNGKARSSFEPLFANYVFVCGGEEERYRAVATGSICKCVAAEDTHELVIDLKQICDLIAMDVPLSPESRLEPGEKVRIRSGPFMGYEGIIVRREKEIRLQVYVRFMDQGVSVSIDDCQVNPL